MSWSGIKTAFMLFLVLALFAVPAVAGSAERILPSSVNADEEFQVTINVADYGEAGQVLENLPQGFMFIRSTLPERAVAVNGNRISFMLIDENSFSYTLKATSSPGTYKFSGLLRDINKADFPVFPADSSIEVKVPSDSGSQNNPVAGYGSNSGISGGGIPSEPQDNIEAKELSQEFVTSGQLVRFEFPKGSTCIRYVEFDSKKTLRKVNITVEMLKGQSKLVSSLPSGKIYKNVNLWMGASGGSSLNDTENDTIGFRVEKAWLEKNGINLSFVALWHYDTAWSKLETHKVGEDSTYVYFEARTPGFGHFVIAVNDESANMKSSDSTEDSPINSTNSGAKSPVRPAGKKIGLSPGFESLVSVCIFGTVYRIMRKKN